MIKVKGQVSEMVLRLDDPEEAVRDLVKRFFHELSSRVNNPVYNLLPDIISRLSADESLDTAGFNRAMAFLLGLIAKDKQSESLAEKLCHRFPLCDGVEAERKLAFCLSKLKMSDKGIKRLSELTGYYKDALQDEHVYRTFVGIAAKAKKFAKSELKETVAEWEAKLTAHFDCEDAEAAAAKAKKALLEGNGEAAAEGEADENVPVEAEAQAGKAAIAGEEAVAPPAARRALRRSARA